VHSLAFSAQLAILFRTKWRRSNEATKVGMERPGGVYCFLSSWIRPLCVCLFTSTNWQLLRLSLNCEYSRSLPISTASSVFAARGNDKRPLFSKAAFVSCCLYRRCTILVNKRNHQNHTFSPLPTYHTFKQVAC